MFVLSSDASKYIRSHGGKVVITMSFVPAMGGCQCKGVQIWGSYIPEIAIACGTEPIDDYLCEEQDGIYIWYPKGLLVKQGYAAIKIRLKSVLINSWLEMDGAKGATFKPER